MFQGRTVVCPVTSSDVAGASEAIFYYGATVSNQNLLYVPDQKNNVVYELNSQKDGTQIPISTLAVQAPMDVALGPNEGSSE